MIGGAVFRMCEGRRGRYDDGFRREALKLIRAGVGCKSLARRLAMPVHTAKQWVMLYRSGGEEAVMGSRGNRRYDWETNVFCQIFVGRFGVSFSPFERLFLGRFGFGQSCGLSVIA